MKRWLMMDLIFIINRIKITIIISACKEFIHHIHIFQTSNSHSNKLVIFKNNKVWVNKVAEILKYKI